MLSYSCRWRPTVQGKRRVETIEIKLDLCQSQAFIRGIGFGSSIQMMNHLFLFSVQRHTNLQYLLPVA